MWLRYVTTVFVLFFGLGSVVHGQDASKDTAMKAWSSFLGKWTVTSPEGTGTAEVTRSNNQSSFVHQAQDVTHVIGWDAANKSLKSISFGSDGSHMVGQWKVVGDGPKFEGHVTRIESDGTEAAAVTLVITFLGRDRWELVIGEQKMTGERAN